MTNQKDLKRKKLIKEMSRYGEVTECVICHKPCLRSYFESTFFAEKDTPTKYRMSGRYGGSGIKCYYPDGKQNCDIDIRLEDWPVCCNPCNKKHFEQSFKTENLHNPITDIGRKIVAEHCIFPYPETP